VTHRGKRAQDIKTAWRAAARRAGLDAACRPYSLRHTSARWMRLHGVPAEQVSQQLGHRKLGTTGVYTEYDAEYLKAACEALDGLLQVLLAKTLPVDTGSDQEKQGKSKRCCRSSVVEHSLGKGEVVCSIHTGSTMQISQVPSAAGASRAARSAPNVFVPQLRLCSYLVALCSKTSSAMTKRAIRLVAIGASLGLLAQPSLAFQERSVGGDSATSAAGAADLQMPNLNLGMPDLSVGKGTATEVRIPGMGSIGVLPKLDLGLELLYGANESNGRPDDKSLPSDVQIRATIKHRF